MKILTVVGARPQFIKAAMVSRVLRKNHKEILVHTGQHYDYNMSQQFFDELDLPTPDYNLGISGGSHAQMTGRMIMALEEVMIKENPDYVLIYGDTNSTLAAAITAAKLHFPICHVEAGARTRSITNPEEINRVCTDHVSTLLFASSQSGMENLIAENLSARAYFTGNPMYDAFMHYKEKLKPTDIKLNPLTNNKKAFLEGIYNLPNKYYYLTCHREENTNDDKNLLEIFKAMQQLDYPTIYPVHPRNNQRALRLQAQYGFSKIVLVEPVGYVESICILKNAEKIVTDSGGLQTESFFAKKKCVTILNFVCWPETMVGGRNNLSAPVEKEILDKLSIEQRIDETYQPFGDGHSAEKIVHYIEKARI